MKNDWPKVKYFCGDVDTSKNCENLKFMHYYYTCTKTDDVISLSKITPKSCPYLLKTIRKQKIENINESRRNL